MASVTLDQVTKSFRSKDGEVSAVDDLSLAVADREFVVLVGPSGCGKTTTLRLIAGLEEVTAGTIRIGDRVVNDVAPRDRDIAMVFQNYALYPHMTVFNNMAFGLKMRRVPKSEIKCKVGEAARLLGIEHLLDRKPGALSGGERQRVALGRAIVRKPQVFLFDEPLSNLDARLRTQMRTEIKSLHRDLKTTILYVTHDQEEAMTLGNRIVILKEGVVQQCGTPLTVYNHPANRFVGGFIGTPPMNFLPGRLEGDGEAVFFTGRIGRLAIPPELAKTLKPHRGEAVALGIRPEHFRLAGAGGMPAWGGAIDPCQELDTVGEMVVRDVEPLGESTNVHLEVPTGDSVVARVSPTVTISPGQRVKLLVAMSQSHFFGAGERGERLN
ncbi:MAG: sn-glycerol-3-phosphate ABC transporter ATP-binding protein UgpC [Phycisphaerae bacterium]